MGIALLTTCTSVFLGTSYSLPVYGWNTRGFACVCVCVCVCVYVCPLELYVYQSEAMLVMVKQIVIRWTC